jgi:hypothetical protein
MSGYKRKDFQKLSRKDDEYCAARYLFAEMRIYVAGTTTGASRGGGGGGSRLGKRDEYGVGW